MSRKKGDLAQAGPASTRAGTPTVSPADTVRTLTLNSPLTDVSPVPIKKLTHLAGAALANPNTTREGRRHAKWELRRMVRALFFLFLTGSYDATLTSRAVEVRLMCRS